MSKVFIFSNADSKRFIVVSNCFPWKIKAGRNLKGKIQKNEHNIFPTLLLAISGLGHFEKDIGQYFELCPNFGQTFRVLDKIRRNVKIIF